MTKWIDLGSITRPHSRPWHSLLEQVDYDTRIKVGTVFVGGKALKKHIKLKLRKETTSD